MLQTGRGPCKGGGESAGGNEGHCPEAPQVDTNYLWGMETPWLWGRDLKPHKWQLCSYSRSPCCLLGGRLGSLCGAKWLLNPRGYWSLHVHADTSFEKCLCGPVKGHPDSWAESSIKHTFINIVYSLLMSFEKAA